MAGEFLQLLRVFRLKNALVQCVSDKVFLDMPQEFQFLGPLVKNDKNWDLHFAVCQLLYPLMHLLRLADMRVNRGMDKVKYYAMQVDRLMSNGLDNAVEKWKDAPKVELAMAANRKLPKPSEQEVINGKCMLLFARIKQQSNSSILYQFLLDLSDEEEDSDEDSVESESSMRADSDDEDEPTALMDDYEEFVYWARRHWNFYKPRLFKDYPRVGYLLSPHPIIQAHTNDPENMDPEDRLACERVIVKLFMPDFVPDNDSWERKKADVMDAFWSEFEDFHNHVGMFKQKSIWFAAERDDCLPHEWHKRYSFPYTKWLGKVACRVLSKCLGIGEAERNWKQAKKQQLLGPRGRLSAEKTKMQSTVAAAYAMEKSAIIRRAACQRAGAPDV